jgi:hypothetical protein
MIEKFARPSVHKNVVLVGHKCDLNEKRKITSEQGKEFANKNGWLCQRKYQCHRDIYGCCPNGGSQIAT